MERTEPSQVECRHHWVLGQPREGVVPGRCRQCGAEREYPAVLDDFERMAGSERTVFSDDVLGTGVGGARPSWLVG